MSVNEGRSVSVGETFPEAGETIRSAAEKQITLGGENFARIRVVT
jgi:hypothetical protein